MAKLTRSNIAHDLNISPHKVQVCYSDEVITYVFSSDWYRQKFIDRAVDNREKISESLTNRFGFIIKNNKLADLKLYITIEKRGFLIFTEKDKLECLSHVVLDGGLLMKKN